MTAYQGVRVTATTAGVTSSPFEHLRVNYVYGGDKPGDGTPKRTGEYGACGGAQATLREQRIQAFADALKSLGAGDPKTATVAQVIEAGKRVGVGEKTARSYRSALKKQRGGSHA